jgi:hypothetical protein
MENLSFIEVTEKRLRFAKGIKIEREKNETIK